MEENFRASMMPAYEEFIKILSASFAENSSAGWNLWRLELAMLKALKGLAVQALGVLIELTQGTGYSGARRECSGCGGPMKFENYRQRQLLSSFGQINYERAYYYCIWLTLTLFRAGRYHLRFRRRQELSHSALCLSPYRIN